MIEFANPIEEIYKEDFSYKCLNIIKAIMFLDP